MNIAKVVRAYFLFVMVMVASASLTYNETVNGYLLSVIHSVEDFSQEVIGDDTFEPDHVVVKADFAEDKTFVKNKSAGTVSYEVQGFLEDPYVMTGEDDVKLMEVNLKPDGALEVKNLVLSIEGADPDNFDNFRLMNGEEIVGQAGIAGEDVRFDDLDIQVLDGDLITLAVVADVGKDFKTGKRFRFQIEEADDFVLQLDGADLELNGYYPMNGPYLSIVTKSS